MTQLNLQVWGKGEGEHDMNEEANEEANEEVPLGSYVLDEKKLCRADDEDLLGLGLEIVDPDVSLIQIQLARRGQRFGDTADLKKIYKKARGKEQGYITL